MSLLSLRVPKNRSIFFWKDLASLKNAEPPLAKVVVLDVTLTKAKLLIEEFPDVKGRSELWDNAREPIRLKKLNVSIFGSDFNNKSSVTLHIALSDQNVQVLREDSSTFQEIQATLSKAGGVHVKR